MLKLHGFSVSNYYNVVKAALLEKGLAFEEVLVYPSSDERYLSNSPMGKVPCLETEEGSFSEAQVMLDYLEEAYPEPALIPGSPFQRAKTREINRVLELYLELQARRVYPEAFFGGQVSEQTKQEVREALKKGAAALRRLTGFQPWILGQDFTSSDLVAGIHLPLVRDAGRKVLDMDIFEQLPGVKEYLGRVRERPSMQRVMDDYKAGLEAFMKKRKGA
ncbi:MAG: glutathione S-transferase [Ectothiorhodospiraceae bacterium]|nr:glutathione S-transferase [Ectothiorhodospiraceae bacterium]